MDLVSTCIKIADEGRKIVEDFGLRPYEVWLIKTRWSGIERGEKEEIVVMEKKIIPIPIVTGLGGIGRILHSVGIDEIGSVIVEGISLLYSEEDLTGGKLEKNENFFWEVRLKDGKKRRFILSGIPEKNYRNFSWRVILEKADEDRK